MNINNFNSIRLLSIIVILIFFINLITILSDSSRSSNFLLEKINKDSYYLLTPIFFESLKLDNDFIILNSINDQNLINYISYMVNKGELFVCQGFSVDIKKNIFLILNKENKYIDKLFCTSLYENHNYYILIDEKIIKQNNFENIINKLDKVSKKVLFKAHLINNIDKYISYNKNKYNSYDKNSFLNNESSILKKKIIESRIKRAFKERSCNVIINMQDGIFNDNEKKELLLKPYFIKSLVAKKILYLLIGIISNILSISLLITLSKLYKSISCKFYLIYIINSIFLIIYYIFSLFFCQFLKFKYFYNKELFILFFQISTFLLYIILFIYIIKENQFIENSFYLKTLLTKILIGFTLSFLTSVTINTLFFTDVLYWLKPPQYLTYFFYFSPLIILFIINYKKEKFLIPLYLLGSSILYLFFKLRDNGVFLTQNEIILRDFIENVLIARFRFREILFYFIFSLFFFLDLFNIKKFIEFKLLQKIRYNFPSIYTYFILFPFLTIVNSYYHSYTPLYISFLRTIFSLLFGILFSLFLSLFLILLSRFKLLYQKKG